MSEKSKASTLAALTLAGVMAITPAGPAVSQETPAGPAVSQETPAGTTTAQATTQQAQQVRYLDVTARNDGWIFAQNLAIVGSGERRIVIVSYSDPQTTRAFYDTALQFARPPQSLPIYGVVRAPQHPTEPNPNGFDIYINGVPLGEVPNPDSAYSRTQFFAAIMDNVRREYFGARAAAQADPIGIPSTALAANIRSGGNKSSGGSASGGGAAGSGSGSAGGSAGDSAAGGKSGGSTEVAAIVFNPDL